jgi:hypothetical protein
MFAGRRGSAREALRLDPKTLIGYLFRWGEAIELKMNQNTDGNGNPI